MRINSITPFYPLLPQASEQAQGAPALRKIFRPFIQPAVQHRFVRPVQRHYTQQNRRLDTAAPSPRNTQGGNYDATLRANDPYIHRANRQSFSKQQAIEQLTRQTTTWQDSNRDNKTEISYYFNRERGVGFSDAQKQAARRSIESWGDVANLAFTENGAPAEGRLTFRISDKVKVADGAYPYRTFKDSVSGDTRYNPAFVTRNTLTHEIGHALGLSHPGAYDGQSDDTQRAYAQDSKAHSVMSYYNAQSSGKNLNHNPLAPMMDDISAIQHKYGANYQTRREDNTYGFNSNTGRDYYSLRNARDVANFCIWDGGGNDTLDVSGYHQNQVINLKDGSFSDIGGWQGNVSIARGSIIENAIGGSGNDALIGNAANNRLTGGAGGDRMRGGAGADTFVYNHASDSTPENPDVIMDFTTGTDKIDVSQALKNAGLPALSFAQTWSGKAGEAILTYDEQSGTGAVFIDMTGNGRADVLIRTHGQVKPGDIVHASGASPAPLETRTATPTPIERRLETLAPRPPFTFTKASESGMANSRLLTDFISGKDQIDLRGVQEEANTRFKLVKAFTGEIGDTVVSFNPQTQRYFIAVDLTGDRKTDFLVRSTQLLRAGDVIAG